MCLALSLVRLTKPRSCYDRPVRDWPVTASPTDSRPAKIEPVSDYVPDAAARVNAPEIDVPLARRTPVALCLDCDYPLNGLLSHACPECGREFNPADPSTMNLWRPLGHAGRLILRPVGLPTVAVILALLAPAFWWATDPQLYYMVFEYILAGAMLAAVGIVQFFRSLPKWILLARLGQSAAPANDRLHWRVIWRVSVVAVLLVVFKVPMRLAFLASQPAFERTVDLLRANPAAPLAGARIGIYTVHDYSDYGTVEAPNILIHTSVYGGGFRYSPGGPKRFGYNPGDEGHLWGPWYWFSTD